MNFEEAYKLLIQDMQERETFYRLAILSYQLGDVQKATVYMRYYGKVGCHKELELALADLIAQTHIFCIQQQLNYEELEKLGLQRLLDFISKRMR